MRIDWQAKAVATDEYYRQSVTVSRECVDGKFTSTEAEAIMKKKRKEIASRLSGVYWRDERKRRTELKKQRRYGS